MSPIRILLADDHAITREGTRRILEGEADLEVAGEAADGEEALRLTEELRPDIVVLDISMPGLNGVQVAEVLRRDLPDIRIVILTGYDSEQYARALVRLGVQGFLSKAASSEELVGALRAVRDGNTYFQPMIVEMLGAGEAPASADEPSPREMEVLRLVAEGLRNRDVARRLCTSDRTVQFHLANLFYKFKAGSRTELVHVARRRGWLV